MTFKASSDAICEVGHHHSQPSAEVIARSEGARALYHVGDCARDPLAAVKWMHNPADVLMKDMAQNVLAFHVRGSLAVTKTAGRHRVVKRPTIGSATFMRSDMESCWTLPETCQVLHLYLSNETFAEYRDEYIASMGEKLPTEFFALEDRWLMSYFHLLCAEFEIGAALSEGRSCEVDDVLLLTQTKPLLVRHLLRVGTTRGDSALPAEKRVSPLRPFLVKRVEAFVQANLSAAVSVGDLAEQVHLSGDHFLKAFFSATGYTPYSYVVKMRLDRAQDLLKQSQLPVAEVAARVGFRNASNFCTKFHKHVGVTPSVYRKQA